MKLRILLMAGMATVGVLLFAAPALADACLFSAAPPFQLSSDAVEWTMQIASGTTCIRGLKLGPTNITEVKLVTPPQSGQVGLDCGHVAGAARAACCHL